MKRVIICGDSFMSPCAFNKDTHFSEIFAKSLDWQLISYARPGMSNGGICLQLETAIKSNPDFILFSTTWADRIEFSIHDKNKSFDFDITDIVYTNLDQNLYLSDPSINKNPRIVSESLGSLTSHPHKHYLNIPEWQEKHKAIHDYFRYLYNFEWKLRTDKLQIYAILHKLELSKIPYLFCFDHVRMEPYNSVPWLTKKNDLREEFELIWYTRPKATKQNPEMKYHTGIQEQKELAKIVLEHHQKYF